MRMTTLTSSPEGIKWMLEYQARRQELQGQHNERIQLRPMKGRQARAIAFLVPESPRPQEPSDRPASVVTVAKSKRVINRVFAGVK